MQRRIGLAGLGGLLLALGFMMGIGAAQAQAVPPGSYLRSCREVQVRNNRDVAAFCATRDGQWTVTRLNDFRSCRGDISNQNGQLWCERRGLPPIPPSPPAPPPPGPGGFGPPGSYRQTCNRVEFRNGVLTAFCRARNGSWQPAMLNTRECAPGADISNQNGVLFCPPQRAMQPPPGSYLASCRNVSLNRAGVLQAQCRRINGSWAGAALNVNQCSRRGDISNQNGILVCN